MNIEKLKLKNFRNYSDKEITFKPNLNVIFGFNGIGKTNIVESIYACSYLNSPRTKSDSELINFDSEGAVVEVQSKFDLRLVINRERKVCYKNGVLIKKQSEFLGLLKVVFFSPETVDLLLKSPVERRKYLDLLLCILDPVYIKHLNSFNKIIKQRNDYLKQLYINSLADRSFLDVINDEYVKLSGIIFRKRASLAAELNKLANEFFKNFFTDSLDIVYDVKYKLSYENYEQDLLEKLNSRYEKELQLGQTTVGPNRDDLIFYIDSRDAKYFCSKGQQRTILISLKIAEAFIIKNKFDDFPILILDDVLSELDEKRQNLLFSLIKSYDIQVIVTAASINDINSGLEYNLIAL